MKFVMTLVMSGLVLGGCARNPAQPDGAGSSSLGGTIQSASALEAKPGYEPAYYNNTTVTINAIEVPQNVGPLAHAAADFYQVVYPDPTVAAWPSPPMCNPCDHQGNGVDFTDFHDHLLDSIPGDPGHGEFNPLWHVFVIVPIPGKEAQYAARLPMKSEAAVDKAIADHLAVEIDTHFYFLCAVVNAHAAK